MHGLSLPTYAPRASMVETVEATDPSTSLQIAVLIAMPCKSRTHHDLPEKRLDDPLREYQIGVARVPWDDDTISTKPGG